MSRNVVHCATEHGPVAEGPSIPLENTARNILVPGGPTETKNGQVSQHKTTAKEAAAREMSTRRGSTARYKTQCLTAREDVNNLNTSLSDF